jgi:hypothetical protein
VRQLVHCGMLFLPGLAFAGLCLAPTKSQLHVGGRAAIRGVQLCGKWSLIVFCGVFKGKDASRTSQGLQRNSYITFSFLFTPGLWAGLPHDVLAFQFFFLTSLPSPSPPCILHMY